MSQLHQRRRGVKTVGESAVCGGQACGRVRRETYEFMRRPRRFEGYEEERSKKEEGRRVNEGTGGGPLVAGVA